jgi:urease accessory protein
MQKVTIVMTDNALLQLLRLSSQALPIGGYAYSQGLETVCDNGTVDDEESLYVWIQDMLRNGLGLP